MHREPQGPDAIRQYSENSTISWTKAELPGAAVNKDSSSFAAAIHNTPKSPAGDQHLSGIMHIDAMTGYYYLSCRTEAPCHQHLPHVTLAINTSPM